MTRFFLILITLLLLAYSQAVHAQTCPQGSVCYTQDQNNEILKQLNAFVAAKDLIVKLQAEGIKSDSAIAAANNLIAALNQRDEINGQIILKYKDVIALQDKVIAMYQAIVDKMQAQLNKPKSAWQKFIQTLREVAYLAGGILLGRAIP